MCIAYSMRSECWRLDDGNMRENCAVHHRMAWRRGGSRRLLGLIESSAPFGKVIMRVRGFAAVSGNEGAHHDELSHRCHSLSSNVIMRARGSSAVSVVRAHITAAP